MEIMRVAAAKPFTTENKVSSALTFFVKKHRITMYKVARIKFTNLIFLKLRIFD